MARKKIGVVVFLVLFLIPLFSLFTNGNDIETVEYYYIYEALSKSVPVYTKGCTPTIDAKNASHIEDCIIEVTYKTEYYNGDRIGLVVGDKTYNTPNLNVNVEEGYLYICNVPVGDRNWEEYPKRQYEIDKKVCKEIDLLK